MLLLFASFGCADDKASNLQAEGQKLMEQGNPGGAVVFFRNALEKKPTDFGIRLDLARAYLQLGKLEQANDEFEKCIRQKADDPALNLELAKFSFVSRKHEDANKYLQIAETGTAPTAESRELAALIYSAEGKLDDAEAALKEALAIDPTYRNAAIGLIGMYLAGKKPKEALELTESLLKEDPDYVSALRMRADIAMRTNDLPKAEECYRKLVSLDGSDVNARYMLGEVLIRQKKLEDAKLVRDGMATYFADTAQFNMLNGLIAYENGEYADAATLFQNSVDRRPSIDGYYRLAIAQQRINNTESALSSLRRLLDVAPRHAQALQMTAQLLLDQGRLPEALREAEKIVEYYENSAAAHFLLGTVLNAQGETERSLTAFAKALELDPAMSEANMRRSAIFMQEQRFDEAKAELDKAIDADAGNITARTALFNFYLGQRNLAAAERVVTEGLAELPTDPTLLTLKASLLASQKKETEALEALAQAKKAVPDYRPALMLELRLHTLAGRTAEALAVCEGYLQHHPDDVNTLLSSASLLDMLQRGDEAEARLQKAYALGSGAALVSLVRRDIIAGKAEQGEKRLLQALERDPSPQLRDRIVEFYLGQNNFDKAWNLYDSIEKELPKEAALGKFRLLAATGKNERALEQAKVVASLEPGSSMGAFSIADALEKLGRADEALAELEKAYRFNQDPALLIAMGQLCSRMQQFEKAESFYGTALKQNKKNVRALSGLGYVALMRKDYAKAVSSYERAMELAPLDVSIVNNLAMALAEQGQDTPRAVELATKAFVGNPGNDSILDTLGFCLLADKRVDEAVNVLQNAILAFPDTGVLHYRLGTALLAKGDTAGAVKALEKAVELGKFSEEAQARELLKKNS